MFYRKANATIINPQMTADHWQHLDRIWPENAWNLRLASKKLMNIDPDDSYIYVVCDGIHWSTDDKPIVNGNGDCFHRDELLKLRASDSRLAYQTWIRKGSFVYHKSSDVGGDNHIGFIVDVWPDFEKQSVKFLIAMHKRRSSQIRVHGGSNLLEAVQAGKWKDVSMGCTAG